jgi:tetratricopeptide (TPR) repeat protein
MIARDAAIDLDKASALTQIARTLGLQANSGEARAVLAEADLLLSATGQHRAQYWIELGRIEREEGHAVEALSCFQRSFELATEASDEYLAVDAAHMIAIVAPQETQIERGHFALSLARKASDEKTRGWIGSIVNNLGYTYMELGQPHDAVNCFREALSIRLSQKEETPIRLGRYALGSALRATGEINEAIQVLSEALATGGSIGFIEEELAECLSSIGKTIESKPLFRAAYDKLGAGGLGERDPERLAQLLARSL